MPYANGFNGDQKNLEIILKTLEAKTYAIPGVTVNADLQVTSMGETAYFYVQGAPSAAGSHTLGTKLTETSSGVKRIDVSLATGYGIHTIIPNANYATVAPDVVEAKVAQESVKKSNLFNEEFVVQLTTDAVAKTYTKDKTALPALLEAIGTFKKDNKANALKPTGVLASVDFYNDLLIDLKGRSTDRTDDILFDGQIVMVAGIPVIECVDLTAVEFILVHAEGVAAPVNVNSLLIVDGTAAGYPASALISGEMGRGFKVVKYADQPVLGSGGYHVAKVTEALS